MIWNNYFLTDAEDPTIQNCPSNQSLETDLGKPTAVVSWINLNASDNSRQLSTVTCDPESGNQFGIGKTKVICEAVDFAGNRATCVFTVNIQGKLIIFVKYIFNGSLLYNWKRIFLSC